MGEKKEKELEGLYVLMVDVDDWLPKKKKWKLTNQTIEWDEMMKGNGVWVWVWVNCWMKMWLW